MLNLLLLPQKAAWDEQAGNNVVYDERAMMSIVLEIYVNFLLIFGIINQSQVDLSYLDNACSL